MDALRKAEEEKKQAEKGSQSDTEAETKAAASQSSEAETESPANAIKVDEDLKPDSNMEQESSSIPDTSIEFDEPAKSEVGVDLESLETSEQAVEESTAKKSAEISFELEPKSTVESTRTPLESPAEEAPAESPQNDNVLTASSENAEEENLDELETSNIESAIDSGLELSMGEDESQSLSAEETENVGQDDSAGAEGDAIPDRAELQTTTSNEASAGELEPDIGNEIPPVDDEDDRTAALFAIPQPKVEKQNNEESTSQDERISAKSVFAAKRAKQKQVRNLRLAGIGVAAVVVLGAGFVYFYLTNSTSSGITVPDDFVAGQQTFLNEEASLLENEAIEESVDLDSLESIPAAVEPTIAQADTTEMSELVVEEQVEDQVEIAEESIDAAVIVETSVASPALAANDLQTAESILDTTQTVSQVIGGPEDAPVIAATETETQTESVAVEQSEPADTETPTTESEVELLAVETENIVEEEPVDLISFSRRETQSTIDPMLANAYIAYQSGNLGSARSYYEQALASSPLSRDALLGLAAIAVAEDQQIQAMELYSQLLARDPADPVARAGLLDLQPVGSPAEVERELRRLVDMHRDVAPLYYALGNYYASQDQWSGAQSQYFRALQIAKSAALQGQLVNPDFAFNLAVSLEHLNQAAPA